MSLFNDPNHERRRSLFDGPQRDPTRRHKTRDVPYFRKGHDRVLMPDDFMPVGPHAGKHLRAVPIDYLLWVDAQPWAQQWAPWAPVHDYMTRFILDAQSHPSSPIPDPPSPILFVDPCTIRPNASGPFVEGCSCLHTLPGHEDLLHTFAVGALGLKTAWYQNHDVSFPHYPLTSRKHARALQHGALQIDRATLADHTDLWHQFFRTQRRPATDDQGYTPCQKTPYANKRAADSAANYRLHGRRSQKHNRPTFLRSYHCTDCNLWHLTSKPLHRQL